MAELEEGTFGEDLEDILEDNTAEGSPYSEPPIPDEKPALQNPANPWSQEQAPLQPAGNPENNSQSSATSAPSLTTRNAQAGMVNDPITQQNVQAGAPVPVQGQIDPYRNIKPNPNKDGGAKFGWNSLPGFGRKGGAQGSGGQQSNGESSGTGINSKAQASSDQAKQKSKEMALQAASNLPYVGAFIKAGLFAKKHRRELVAGILILLLPLMMLIPAFGGTDPEGNNAGSISGPAPFGGGEYCQEIQDYLDVPREKGPAAHLTLSGTRGKWSGEKDIDSNGVVSTGDGTVSMWPYHNQVKPPVAVDLIQKYYVTARWPYVSMTFGTYQNVANKDPGARTSTQVFKVLTTSKDYAGRKIIIYNKELTKGVVGVAMEYGPAPWTGTKQGDGQKELWDGAGSKSGPGGQYRLQDPEGYAGKVVGGPKTLRDKIGVDDLDTVLYGFAVDQNRTPGETVECTPVESTATSGDAGERIYQAAFKHIGDDNKDFYAPNPVVACGSFVSKMIEESGIKTKTCPTAGGIAEYIRQNFDFIQPVPYWSPINSENTAKLKRGDIIVYNKQGAGAVPGFPHVGIYAGEGKVINTTNSLKVKLEKIEVVGYSLFGALRITEGNSAPGSSTFALPIKPEDMNGKFNTLHDCGIGKPTGCDDRGHRVALGSLDSYGTSIPKRSSSGEAADIIGKYEEKGGTITTSVPIYAPFSGKVTNKELVDSSNERAGWQLVIESADKKYAAALLHLKGDGLPAEGSSVTVGQQLGTLYPMSAAYSYPHLHFELWVDGKAINAGGPGSGVTTKKIWEAQKKALGF